MRSARRDTSLCFQVVLVAAQRVRYQGVVSDHPGVETGQGSCHLVGGEVGRHPTEHGDALDLL